MSEGPITINRVLWFFYKLVYRLYVSLKVGFYRIKNRNKKKILLFSDSRGFDVGKKQTRFNPFHGYPGSLIKHYNVQYCICPEKHTTIMDFFNRYWDKFDSYDFIVLHAGIVEFSPRHKRVATQLIYDKKPWYDKIFGRDNMLRHLESSLGVEYEGEQTINMYSLDMAEKYLVPKLAAIKNLVWIGCNDFIDGWEGNYPRPRPKNIRIIEDYSRLFIKLLPNSIDLSDWMEKDIRFYTCDNIHLTKAGHDELFKRIDNKISSM